MVIDIQKLREDLEDYFGTAAANGFPAAYMNVKEVEDMSNAEVVKLAEKLGFDLREYEIREG